MQDREDGVNIKERILELLEEHRGETVSGGRLAEMMQVSRNAVWKAVQELRAEGYSIAAVTNKGYSLSEENDILSVPGIRPFLSAGNLSCAGRIHIYPSLESTNRTAKELAIAGAEHGTVVISDSQSAGRGRFSRSFFSPPGGLYMSIVLRPEHLRFENITAVTAWAAVAVCEAIEAVSGKVPTIKWVNDILLDGKKVCGILTEAVTDLESGLFQWIVVGIGVNVHLRTEDLPLELRSSVGSVCPEEGCSGVRNRLAAEILNRMLGAETLPEEPELFARYRKRLMMLGKEITVLQGSDSYRAMALDVDPEGHLIVRKESGELVSLYSGEISIRM